MRGGNYGNLLLGGEETGVLYLLLGEEPREPELLRRVVVGLTAAAPTVAAAVAAA